jgi:hypothetical protein
MKPRDKSGNETPICRKILRAGSVELSIEQGLPSKCKSWHLVGRERRGVARQ